VSSVNIVISEGGRIDVAVVAGLEAVSRSQVSHWIRDGRVRIHGELVTKPSQFVSEGMTVEIDIPDPIPDKAIPQDIPVNIVYQDDDLVVVHKPAGMVVHPGAGHPDGTLVNALLFHIKDLSGIGGVLRPGIVHRLDRGTSGLLVVAKHDKAHQALAAQFADHTATRAYLAICKGKPGTASGTIHSFLGRHPTQRTRFASQADGVGKEAVTHWTRLGDGGGFTLLECHLETGRTHQIRIHLSEQGWPILGDELYGYKRGNLPNRARSWVEAHPGRVGLHAWRLQLRHPTSGDVMEFIAPIPEPILSMLDCLDISRRALPKLLRPDETKGGGGVLE
jgi:23S rRNA pseudouridine1911/1915/1917 synthase